MNPASVIISNILVNSSALDLAMGDDLFIGRLPTGPASCVVIIDAPGQAPQRLYNKGEGDGYFYPRVDLYVRNNDYQAGWNIMQTIQTILHDASHGSSYQAIACTDQPHLDKWDRSGWAQFVSTFELQRG